MNDLNSDILAVDILPNEVDHLGNGFVHHAKINSGYMSYEYSPFILVCMVNVEYSYSHLFLLISLFYYFQVMPFISKVLFLDQLFQIIEWLAESIINCLQVIIHERFKFVFIQIQRLKIKLNFLLGNYLFNYFADYWLYFLVLLLSTIMGLWRDIIWLMVFISVI